MTQHKAVVVNNAKNLHKRKIITNYIRIIIKKVQQRITVSLNIKAVESLQQI